MSFRLGILGTCSANACNADSFVEACALGDWNNRLSRCCRFLKKQHGGR